MRAFESTLLEFNINDRQMQPFRSGHYEIVIRYELVPTTIGWNEIRVIIDRESAPTGLCASSSIEQNLSHRIEPCKLTFIFNLVLVVTTENPTLL